MDMLEGLWEKFQGGGLPRAALRAAIIVMGAWIAAHVVNFICTRVLRRLTASTSTDLDDRLVALMHGPIIKSVVLAGLALATVQLGLGAGAEMLTLRALATIALVLWLVLGLRLSSLLLNQAKDTRDRFRTVEPRTFPLFDNLAKLVLVGLASYMLIVIWGVDATAWLTSAGIVGIAVGFAAKDTLSNLFSGIFIIADSPYQMGDYVVLDSGERGKVVHIGLRSTRLTTRDDIEITIPNAVMGAARITNETRGPTEKQRIRVKVGVAYGSDLDETYQVLLEAAAANEQICKEPAPRVRFRLFGDSGLDLELLCWSPEPELRGRLLHELNTDVYKRLGAAGIEIPYPKRDVYIKELPEGLTGGAATS